MYPGEVIGDVVNKKLSRVNHVGCYLEHEVYQATSVCWMYVYNREILHSPCPRLCLRIWSRETGSAVPPRVSPLILYTRTESSISCFLAGFLPLSAAAVQL